MEDLKQSIENSNLIYSAIRDFPNPVSQEDETENDSDKTFIVPSNKIWEVLYAFVEFSSTATVGDRLLIMNILDSADDIIFTAPAGVVQPASQNYKYVFNPGTYHETAFHIDYLCIPIPRRTLLPAGFKINIKDSAAVDVAADDMIVHMMIDQWDIS